MRAAASRAMIRTRLFCAAVLLASLATALSAAPPPPDQGRAPDASATTGDRLKGGPAGASDRSRVIGTVWDAKDQAIPGARVRLRNVTNGRIERAAVSNEFGQVTFTGIDPASYVLELVNAQGAVLALGQTFVVGPDQTVPAFVRLASKTPWFAGFFSNAAAAAVATAASVGVTAVSPGQPSSAGR